MKLTAIEPDALVGAEGAVTPGSGLWGRYRQLRDWLKEEQTERRLRAELADLDPHILRDIGIADDEIGRVRARDRFTPRNWRF